MMVDHTYVSEPLLSLCTTPVHILLDLPSSMFGLAVKKKDTNEHTTYCILFKWTGSGRFWLGLPTPLKIPVQKKTGNTVTISPCRRCVWSPTYSNPNQLTCFSLQPSFLILTIADYKQTKSNQYKFQDGRGWSENHCNSYHLQ